MVTCYYEHSNIPSSAFPSRSQGVLQLLLYTGQTRCKETLVVYLKLETVHDVVNVA